MNIQLQTHVVKEIVILICHSIKIILISKMLHSKHLLIKLIQKDQIFQIIRIRHYPNQK